MYLRHACCSVKWRLAFIDFSTAAKSGRSYSSDTRLRPSGNRARTSASVIDDAAPAEIPRAATVLFTAETSRREHPAASTISP